MAGAVKRAGDAVGQALLLVVVLASSCLLIVGALLGWAANGGWRSAILLERVQALYVAESGITEALFRLNHRGLGTGLSVGYQSSFASEPAALDWPGASYQVRLSVPSAGKVAVRALGRVGGTTRQVDISAKQVPRAGLFLAGPQGNGVVTTAPGPYYVSDYEAVPVNFWLPEIPGDLAPRPPPQPPDSVLSGEPGYLFEGLRVEGFTLTIVGPAAVYVRGALEVVNKGKIVTEGQVDFYLYGPANRWGWVAQLDGGTVELGGPSVWAVNGAMSLAAKQKDPPVLLTPEPVAISAKDGVVVSRAQMGSDPGEPGGGWPPQLLIVLAPGAGDLTVEKDALLCAAVYAPQRSFSLDKSRLEGAVVARSVAIDKHSEAVWYPELASADLLPAWRAPVGYWETEAGSWVAR